MKIAILGMGTVGSGVFKVIEDNQEQIQKLIKEPIVVTHIFSSEINNRHHSDLSQVRVTEDLDEVLNSGVDLVVETLGGIEFTHGVHKQFLSQGIHVVSANKDMLALHIDELAEIGNENKAQLAYEASCVGGVPIINALEFGLQANKLTRLLGILNGTTNYILDKMTNFAWSYQDALNEAQEKGYAEKDPTNDVEGFDARRKIALLSRLAYRKGFKVEEIPVKGISQVEGQDIELFTHLGLTLKLLGFSEFDGEQISIGVEPMLLASNHPLASVKEAQNAVFVNGNAVGETMFYGPGAGSLETASAIVGDIMNIARFGFMGNVTVEEFVEADSQAPTRSYYLRLASNDDLALLDELAINYDIQQVDQVLVLTEDMTADQLEKLQTQVAVQAIYPIIKD